MMSSENEVADHVAEFCYEIFFWRGEYSDMISDNDVAVTVKTRAGRESKRPLRLLETI